MKVKTSDGDQRRQHAKHGAQRIPRQLGGVERERRALEIRQRLKQPAARLRQHDKGAENKENGDQILTRSSKRRVGPAAVAGNGWVIAASSRHAGAHGIAASRRVFGSADKGLARDLMTIQIMLAHILTRQDAPSRMALA